MISQLVSLIQGGSLPIPLYSPTPGSKGQTSAASANTSSLTLSHSKFAIEVEKHLDDYKKGKGNLSRDVAVDLRARDQATSMRLSYQNPKLLAAYASYRSALSYSQRARFIEGVDFATLGAERIGNAHRGTSVVA